VLWHKLPQKQPMKPSIRLIKDDDISRSYLIEAITMLDAKAAQRFISFV
jgi:hypothetical protein